MPPRESATLKAVKQKIRKLLRTNGTNVEQNDKDPLGDGDQSVITGSHERKQVYRNLFAEGGDIYEHGIEPDGPAFAPFALMSVMGAATKIEEELKKVDQRGKPPDELIKLLETRETSMRLSPLLLIVSMGKNVNIPGTPPGAVLAEYQIAAAKVLLAYGARPDAKDVCGKTVCHYGMGAMATPMTLKVGDMCIAAAESAFLFGKEVELVGLKSKKMNGRRGIARGYQVDTGRREVHLYGEEDSIAVKSENLKLVNGSPPAKPLRLCDVQDRNGAVPLLETVIGDRLDVAKHLLEKHNAAIDIADSDGVSALSMSGVAGAQMLSTVGRLIWQTATKRARDKLKKQCSQCGVTESDYLVLNVCSGCHVPRYCSRECQIIHWKAGHKVECKDLAEAKERGIIMDRPEHEPFMATVSLSTGAASRGGSYRRPSYAAVGEKFHVKVQAGGNRTHGNMLVYDESRECTFTIMPDMNGFVELFDLVRAETATNGMKTYMKASFDEAGNCTMYPGTKTMLTW